MPVGYGSSFKVIYSHKLPLNLKTDISVSFLFLQQAVISAYIMFC